MRMHAPQWQRPNGPLLDARVHRCIGARQASSQLPGQRQPPRDRATRAGRHRVRRILMASMRPDAKALKRGFRASGKRRKRRAHARLSGSSAAGSRCGGAQRRQRIVQWLQQPERKVSHLQRGLLIGTQQLAMQQQTRGTAGQRQFLHGQAIGAVSPTRGHHRVQLIAPTPPLSATHVELQVCSILPPDDLHAPAPAARQILQLKRGSPRLSSQRRVRGNCLSH
mmetsp:Transcript_14685/g.43076  ORF Transcript_14685/g.43076 Transcript_14685/m.43076 type:complete len:224 (-) Transcript_14685:1867-2538(-)